jgi:hypothetical protein
MSISRRWRNPSDARAERLLSLDLSGRPLGEVRRFKGERFDSLAEHVAPGRWMLHGRSVHAEALDGLHSAQQERRPGAKDGGWARQERNQ